MKFTWERESKSGSCALSATPGDYDGVPRPAVLVTDLVPRNVSPDRLAAAFVLSFGRFISGEISFPYGIHPEMATAIQEFLRPTTLFFSELDFKPAIIPSGSNSFALNPGGTFEVDNRWKGFDSSRTIELKLPSVSDSFSHNYFEDVLTVPTNAAALQGTGDNDPFTAQPFIAAAVLLSEDFDIGSIRLPYEDPENERSRQLSSLLQATGLTLQFAQ